VYPVVLVQAAIAQVVAAEFAVREVVQAYEHENEFNYCVVVLFINSP
jgi:hypothetical protein